MYPHRSSPGRRRADGPRLCRLDRHRPDELVVIDCTPTGNPVLDPVLAKIAARQEASDTLAWLKARAAEDAERIRDQAMVLLGRRGMLKRREGNLNWAFGRRPDMPAWWRRGSAATRGERSRRRTGRRISQRTREALHSDGIADLRDVALIGLVSVCDLPGEVVPDEDIHRLRLRVAQLRRLNRIGRELVRVVSDIELSGT